MFIFLIVLEGVGFINEAESDLFSDLVICSVTIDLSLGTIFNLVPLFGRTIKLLVFS